MDHDNPIVLRFGDSFLRQSDVEILAGNYWISDQIIAFFWEVLERTYCHNLARRCVFVGPEVAHLIKMSRQEDVPELVTALHLDTADVVFLPVNDAADPTEAGGSHWSLLMYDRQANTFFIYDSYAGFNNAHAERLVDNLLVSLACPQGVQVVEPGCPEQQNHYDCGVHVVYNAHVMMQRVMLGQAGLAMTGVGKFRESMLQCVRNIMTAREFEMGFGGV